MSVTTLAAAVQASVGFGAALLAAPVLLLVHPGFAPGPLLISNLVLTLLVAQRESASIDHAGLRFVIGGRVLGTIPAGLVLASADQASFDALFGVMVLVAVMMSLLRGGFTRSKPTLLIAGVASGLMGTVSSIGGPPVALIYQGTSPMVFRATLAANLIVGATLSLFAVWWAGRLGATELVLAAILVPASVLGFWLSHLALPRIDAGRVRVAVLTLSIAAAAGVLWRAASTMLE